MRRFTTIATATVATAVATALTVAASPVLGAIGFMF